jgi:hypothetical protein
MMSSECSLSGPKKTFFISGTTALRASQKRFSQRHNRTARFPEVNFKLPCRFSAYKQPAMRYGLLGTEYP